jgi:hypothetical protein
MAVLFQIVSRRARDRLIANALEIGGIGSMVYAFLVVTPLHNLMMAIALLFFVVAMLAALALAHREGRPALFWSGLLAFGLLLVCAAMYYGTMLGGLLAIAQKVSIGSCCAWLLAVHHARAQGSWPRVP